MNQALWVPVLYLAGVLLIVGVAIAIIGAIRRWARRGEFADSSAGLTLGQAPQMKAKGLLTEQEYDELKRVIMNESSDRTSSGQAESAL